MKLVVTDVDPESRSQCYRRVCSIIDELKLPFSALSSSIESLSEHRDVGVLVIGQNLIKRYSNQINNLKKIFPSSFFVGFLPDYKLSQTFLEKLALLGLDEVFDGETSLTEIKKRLTFILHKLKRAKGSSGLVVVTGSKGGVGVTTFAAGLSEAILAKQFKVTMVDVDFETQNLTRFLKCKPTSSREYGDILLSNRSLSYDSLSACLFWLNQTGDLCLLPPPTVSEDYLVENPKAFNLFSDALEILTKGAQYVVVDLPSTAAEKLKQLLFSKADSIIFITHLDPGSAVSLITRLNKYKQFFNFASKIVICCNHYSSLGLPISILKKEINTDALSSDVMFYQISACAKGKNWIGSGNTIYGAGGSKLVKELDYLASILTNCEAQQANAVQQALQPLALPSKTVNNF
jgi:MinD-like ATPase involved in chromosome partitioning or flagellar assembly/vacuolar-type H+-ATPase subunit F/Vma7